MALGTELTGRNHYASRSVAKRDARCGSTQRIAEPILMTHRSPAVRLARALSNTRHISVDFLSQRLNVDRARVRARVCTRGKIGACMMAGMKPL